MGGQAQVTVIHGVPTTVRRAGGQLATRAERTVQRAIAVLGTTPRWVLWLQARWGRSSMTMTTSRRMIGAGVFSTLPMQTPWTSVAGTWTPMRHMIALASGRIGSRTHRRMIQRWEQEVMH